MHFGQQHVVLHPLLCDPIFRNEHRRRRRWWSLPNHIFTLYEPMVMPLKKVRKWRIIWQEFQKCPNLLQRQQRPKVVNLSKLDLVTSQWFKTIQFWKPLHFWISKKKIEIKVVENANKKKGTSLKILMWLKLKGRKLDKIWQNWIKITNG